MAISAGEEGMFLDLMVNHTPRGELALYRRPDGDFLVRLSDVPKLGLRTGIRLQPQRIEGESDSFVSLRDLGAASLVPDSSQMGLDVEFPPELFEKTDIDLAPLEARSVLDAEHNSGFLNYRLAGTQLGSEPSKFGLATDLGCAMAICSFSIKACCAMTAAPHVTSRNWCMTALKCSSATPWVTSPPSPVNWAPCYPWAV